jgi:hypothetical protein
MIPQWILSYSIMPQSGMKFKIKKRPHRREPLWFGDGAGKELWESLRNCNATGYCSCRALRLQSPVHSLL